MRARRLPTAGRKPAAQEQACHLPLLKSLGLERAHPCFPFFLPMFSSARYLSPSPLIRSSSQCISPHWFTASHPTWLPSVWFSLYPQQPTASQEDGSGWNYPPAIKPMSGLHCAHAELLLKCSALLMARGSQSLSLVLSHLCLTTSPRVSFEAPFYR